MDEHTFKEKFSEILKKINTLPTQERPRLMELAEETRDRRERLRTSIAELQDSLDYLRLSVKYLVFDLEATRRENSYLRKMLEDVNKRSNRRGSENDDDSDTIENDEI